MRLTQIQLLSHEFKIAGRLEFVVGTLEGSSASGPAGSAAGAAGKAVWRRLGFLSFDTNEHSSFSARELKSVALSGVHAQLLRIIIHRCHANAANFYGQVGAAGPRRQAPNVHAAEPMVAAEACMPLKLFRFSVTSMTSPALESERP